jgi:DNA polymerase III delta subunit
LKRFILKRYDGKISSADLDILVRYKSAHIQKIISEIEKLLLSKEKITKDDIEKNIVPEIEENIFMIIDNLLNKKKDTVLKEIKNTLNFITVYALYNSLLANIRNRVYIDMLKSLHFSQTEIKDYLGLGNKAFLIGKSYKIRFEELKNFYQDLIELDKKMKF